MAQKFYLSTKKSDKPSNLLTILLLIIAGSLLYSLILNIKKYNASQVKESILTLPDLKHRKSEIPPLVIKTAINTIETNQNKSIDNKHDKKGNLPTTHVAPPSAPKKLPLVSPTQPTKPNNGWVTISTKRGDTLGAIFHRAGLSHKTLQAVLNKNPYAKALTRIQPNQQLQLMIRNKILEKLIMPFSSTQLLHVEYKGNSYLTRLVFRPMDIQNQFATTTIHGSLYGSAARAGIPQKIVQQMTEIFNWEIDFSQGAHNGDRFSVLYKGYFINKKLVNTGEIIAVSYTSLGKVHQAVRHTHANGDFDYYTPQGNSLKKAFARYPIKFSHISSTFSLSRLHPILHYRRPHKGVDLAAPIGTPVRATADGRIESIGRRSDYGNMIKISHFNNYSSIYGHMLKFQKGLSRGTHVKRGEIIGYVGQTGLASGPHCHYEFHIGKQPKNPTTVDLPRSASISMREMKSFRAKAAALFNQMKFHEQGHPPQPKHQPIVLKRHPKLMTHKKK
ncbi:MAG: peptidoglycan DD-metalloendopeptidase family protein [Legionella sp.]